MHESTPPSQASRVRIDLARRLAESCPRNLGSEIAVTGSAARGMADQYSDLELNLWVDSLPAGEEWRAWLADSGVTRLEGTLKEMDEAGFRWTVGQFEGIWVEVGWSPIDTFDSYVRDLAGGVYVSHAALQMGWTVGQAVSVRSEGRLAEWQAALATYPDGLAERVIANQTAVWSDPHVPGVRWGLAARGERMGLAMRMLWDMQNLLRILFAMNHVWDRDLKWTDSRTLDLPIRPDRLSERIDAVFTLTDLNRAVETNQRLIVETLQLAAGQGFQVQAALRSVEAGLREGLEETQRG